ncbi:hypothetical protein GQ457_05G023900 [Hibiscus cannabinus]
MDTASGSSRKNKRKVKKSRYPQRDIQRTVGIAGGPPRRSGKVSDNLSRDLSTKIRFGRKCKKGLKGTTKL